MPRKNVIPTYRHHKPSGQAVVTINRRDVYLGPWQSPESRQRYAAALAELKTGPVHTLPPAERIRVGDLALAYLRYADSTYRRPDGTPTPEPAAIRAAVKPLNRLYAMLPAREFSPLKLKAVRGEMIARGWVRSNINRQIARIKSMFKWAVSEELLPPDVYHGLIAVSGLKRGRSDAAEAEPVKPVPDAYVDAVQPYVSRQVWAMIELQRLTGMRGGEVTTMRTADIDTTGEVWFYRPRQHKTAHHELAREIAIGPRAREILRPWLRPDLQAFLFQPAEAEAERNAAKRQARRTKMTPSQARRAERAARRQRKLPPGECYDVTSYRRAIARACDLANPLPAELEAMAREVAAYEHRIAYQTGKPPKVRELPRELQEKRQAVEDFRAAHRWHPHQLRHNAATALRKKFGIEGARVVLGHQSAGVTEIYAELDRGKAANIMREVG